MENGVIIRFFGFCLPLKLRRPTFWSDAAFYSAVFGFQIKALKKRVGFDGFAVRGMPEDFSAGFVREFADSLYLMIGD